MPGFHRKAALARLCACCFTLLLVAQCGPRDARYDPSHFTVRGPIVPAEALVPPGALPGDEMDGVYVVGGDATSCCFIAPHATLVVRKGGAATRLCVGAYVPPVGPFLQRPQGLTARLAGARTAIRFSDLRGGEDYECRQIPNSLRRVTGAVRVRLDSDIDYVPAEFGVGKDMEHYALVLVSIYFD